MLPHGTATESENMRTMLRHAALLLVLASTTTWAQDDAHDHAEHAARAEGCSAFTWNVAHELALMAQPATSIDASREGNAAAVAPDKHYLVRLAPQASVKFALAPARSRNAEGAYAGLVRFRVEQAGRYRVTLTSRHWIDVVDGDHAIATRDFQGRAGCDRMHKVVEFELPEGRDLILQLSGDGADSVGLVITPAPKA